MAAVALNKFVTVRTGITTEVVGIYTCPIGVASIVLLAQATNVSTGASTYGVTAYHSRVGEPQEDYKLVNNTLVPPNDSLNLIPDGRLSLQTNDVIKIQANENGVLTFVLSILETAKQ